MQVISVNSISVNILIICPCKVQQITHVLRILKLRLTTIRCVHSTILRYRSGNLLLPRFMGHCDHDLWSFDMGNDYACEFLTYRCFAADEQRTGTGQRRTIIARQCYRKTADNVIIESRDRLSTETIRTYCHRIRAVNDAQPRQYACDSIFSPYRFKRDTFWFMRA